MCLSALLNVFNEGIIVVFVFLTVGENKHIKSVHVSSFLFFYSCLVHAFGLAVSCIESKFISNKKISKLLMKFEPLQLIFRTSCLISCNVYVLEKKDFRKALRFDRKIPLGARLRFRNLILFYIFDACR